MSVQRHDAPQPATERELASHRPFPTLDGYRAIAALMVLTTHVGFTTGLVLQPVIGPLVSRMDFGVCLFFLLSGFLLYRPWAMAALRGSRGPATGPYLVRRFARIMPAYLVMAVFTLALLPEIQPVPAQSWLSYLTLTHIYRDGAQVEGLTQVWSLATEASFYLVLPLAALVLGLRGRGDAGRSARWQASLLLVVITAGTVVNVLRGFLPAMQGSAAWTFALPSFMDWFAVGMLVALARACLEVGGAPRWARSLERLARDVPTCLLVAVTLYVLACTPIAGSLLPFGSTPEYATTGAWASAAKHALYAACGLFLLLPGFLGPAREGRWREFLAARPLVLMGTVSYGVFLWHLVLLRLIVWWTGMPMFSGGFWWLWPSTIAVSLLAAGLSWIAVERPAQRWSHRVGRRRGLRSTPPPATRPAG